MSAWSQEDYLLRQVRDLARVLGRILGLGAAGQVEQAESELAAAWSGLLGDRVGLIQHLDTASGAALLASPAGLGAVARLFAAQAELAVAAGDTMAARRSRVRAIEYALEAWRRDPSEVAPALQALEWSAAVDADALAESDRDRLQQARRLRPPEPA